MFNDQEIKPPKFQVSKMAGSINVAMNRQMAESLLDLLHDFNELEPHEYAFRAQLEKFVAPFRNYEDQQLSAAEHAVS